MYEFSIGAFIVGVILLVPAFLAIKFQNKLADIIGWSYSKTQIAAFILLGFAFLMMLNIPGWLLSLLAQNLFGGMSM
jgi:hypothetical protein